MKARKVLLTFCLLVGIAGTAIAGTEGFFADPEINRLIDANYKLVQENGYAELRIPESIHHITRESFSPNALETIDRLMKAGYRAYVVGGSVRDLILGKKVNDFDIATDAPVEVHKALFENISLLEVGGRTFGIIHYPDEDIDLAEFQNIPAEYYGHKGIPDFDPSRLTSTNLLFDAFQRDLTINALYYDTSTGDIIDFFGGIYCLRQGILDTLTDSDLEFTGNPRAALRALRFKARYEFRFSDRVEQAMSEHALRYMMNVTPGYFASTGGKMFSEGYARRSYDMLMAYGVFEHFFPPLKELYDTEGYKRYVSSSLNFIDERHRAGEKVYMPLVMSAVLWPLFEETGSIFRVDEILNAEEAVYKYGKGEREAIRNILIMNYEMSRKTFTEESALEFTKRENFSGAYELLQMRSETDSRLQEQLRFWNDVQAGLKAAS